jgi:CheY-like chemotaxis protein
MSSTPQSPGNVTPVNCASQVFDELRRCIGEPAFIDGLRRAAERLVPALGDAVVLDLVVLPEAPARLVLLDEELPVLDVDAACLREQALQVMASVTPGSTLPGQHVAIATPPLDCVCIALASRGRVLGALTLLRRPEQPAYVRDEVGQIEAVGQVLSLALSAHECFFKAERERQALLEEARVKDAQFAELSHELRTPLNAILGWTQLIQRGELAAPQVRGGIDAIARNARTLTRLASGVSDIVGLSSGSLRVEDRLLSFRGVVVSALAAARTILEFRNHRIHADLGTEEALVLGDAARLEEVVVSVLVSVCKIAKADSVVALRLTSDNERLNLLISDRPLVLASEEHAEPPSSGERSSAPGTMGLTLSLARQVTELHGGSLRQLRRDAASKATFVIELPLAVASATLNTLPLTAPESVPAGLLQGMHALLVEDDPDGCDLIEAVLRSLGATVTIAATAHDALIALRDRAPDVIVSDIGLPDEDGLSLMRRIRQSKGFSNLPAVALTAYASQRDVVQALAAGFHAHLAKPVEPNELGATIARISGRPGPSAL